MPLEIKILDYGDIELESSFLVLGRDCGRTRRVHTLGFLILGGAYPIVVDT
ncbi:MAG TPA: N-acyl homoserine lactonase family protein, partial [Roseiarcus sp.]